MLSILMLVFLILITKYFNATNEANIHKEKFNISDLVRLYTNLLFFFFDTFIAVLVIDFLLCYHIGYCCLVKSAVFV